MTRLSPRHLIFASYALAIALVNVAVSAGATQQQPSTGNAAPGFEFEEIENPEIDETGVFITQIGETNRASAEQRSTGSSSRIIQDGAQNEADVVQGASGIHYSSVAQGGDANTLLAVQDGSGQTALLLAQDGDANSATISQSDNGLLYSAAAVLQSGSGNSLVLVQNGDDNQARLTQDGDNNVMTATQLDAGNRLEWVQQGDGLSDLQITQTGGAALQITQTNNGGGN